MRPTTAKRTTKPKATTEDRPCSPGAYPDTWAALLMSLVTSGQVVGITLAASESQYLGRIVHVGGDYFLYEVRNWHTGKVCGLRAIQVDQLQDIELRPLDFGREDGVFYSGPDD